MGSWDLRQINATTRIEKDRHQFEDLSKKIIGAAIAVHRELARPPRLGEPRLRLD
jgi:hypothetical protein